MKCNNYRPAGTRMQHAVLISPRRYFEAESVLYFSVNIASKYLYLTW